MCRDNEGEVTPYFATAVRTAVHAIVAQGRVGGGGGGGEGGHYRAEISV